MYREFLADSGYAPKIDEDGDIVFRYEGMTFFIQVDDDEEFFRVLCPNFWKIESDDERNRVAQAACQVNARIKVAKVWPHRDDTWASVEMYCSPPDVLLPVFVRSLDTLRGIIREFRQEMHKDS